jgi:serine/threonine-protein kinase
MLGPAGFGKTVAMKRLHAQYANDPEFVKMFHDEARVTSELSHANIVMTLDALEEDDALYLVMEYVHGASLAQLQRSKRIPIRIGTGIIAAMLDGLNAAHEARDENGEPLGIIHRDVSPQNVLVSFQGVAKLADFGIAKAAGRAHSTNDGSAKGKISYMAPEQVLDTPLGPRTDIYSAGIVLWECLTGKRLIDGTSTADNVRAVLKQVIPPPSSISEDIPREVDDVVMRALKRDPAARFASAKEMGLALRKSIDVADPAEIGDWLRSERGDLLAQRDKGLVDLQRSIGVAAGTAIGIGPPARVSSLEGGSDESSNGSAPSGAQYVAEGDGAPPRVDTRRWLPVIVALLLLGIAGITLVVISVRRRPPVSAVPSTLASSTPAVTPSEGRITSGTTPAPTASAPDTVELDEPAPSSSTRHSTTTTSRPRPPATSFVAPKRKCRIVAAMDSDGHTTFKEVCP